MALVIVGSRRGKRVICWGGFAKLALFITPIPGFLAAGVVFFLSHRWSNEALLIGLGAGFGVAILVLLVNLLTPAYKLPILSDWHPPKTGTDRRSDIS